jgi:AcrR family transcriptional regulator
MARGHDTRERLLAAATATIAASGEAGLRIRDIAMECGVSDPTIYHFFGSREGLVEEAFARLFVEKAQTLNAEFDRAVRACASATEFRDVVISALRVSFGPVGAAARSTRVMVLGAAQSRPSLMARLVEAQRDADLKIASGLAYAKQQGWTRPDLDVQASSMWAASLIFGRALAEMDPARLDEVAWDDFAITAALQVLFDQAAAADPATALR